MFAFTFTPTNRLADGEAGASAVSTYIVQPDGTLADPKSLSDNQTALCWIQRVGRFYYVSNTGSDDLSGYEISADGQPSLIGPETATLKFSDDGGASPQLVNMTGTGTIVTVSPPSLTFARQTVGTTSSPQSVTLTNRGATTLHINSVSLTGTNATDFLISFDSCPPDLVAGL